MMDNENNEYNIPIVDLNYEPKEYITKVDYSNNSNSSYNAHKTYNKRLTKKY